MLLSFDYREKAGCDDTDHFMVFHKYEDSMTVGLVVAASETLGR